MQCHAEDPRWMNEIQESFNSDEDSFLTPMIIIKYKIDSVKIPLYSFLQANTCSYAHLTELRMVMEPGMVRIAASRITKPRTWKKMDTHYRHKNYLGHY